MSFTKVIESCKRLDIKLGVKNEKLVIKDPAKNLNGELMDQLKQYKSEILHWLTKDFEKSHSTVSRTPRTGRVPLSFAQQGLWFIDQLEGGSAQYNMPMAFSLKGAFKVKVLQKALATMVARHEVLRTTFAMEDAESYQVIHPPGEVPINLIDLSGLTDKVQATHARALASSEAKVVFDLGKDLMLRCRVLILSQNHHVILITLHHIAADGWSMGILVREINLLFEAYGAGKANPLPDLDIQYADFAYWQRQQFPEDERAKALDYWKSQLAGIPLVHELPLDKPRPAQQSFEGAIYQQRFEGPLFGELQQLASAHDVTLFILLQAAFALLVGRLSLANDVVIGVPTAGRSKRELAPLMGFFINTLPFRTRLSGNPSFEQLLNQMRQVSMEAFANETIPFEMLVKELKPERSLSYSPIFQLALSMQTQAGDGAQVEGVRLSGFDRDLVIIKYDLELSVAEGRNSINLVWRYSQNLFEERSIQVMASSFTTLLQHIVAQPTCPVNALPLVQQSERDALQQWGTGGEVPTGTHLLVQWEAQVAASPDQVAVHSPVGSLSYRQLDVLANRLANYLEEQEIGPGSRVGLFLKRSPALMVGILGILKSGAAYVPLELTNTRARVGSIVADADMEIVLVESQAIDRLPVSGIDILLLDEALSDSDWLQEYDGDPPDLAPDLDAPIYVIYTSGSTGQPKGVEISHRGVADYCRYAYDHYNRSEPELSGALLVTSHCFDISVPSLFLPLLTGGTLELLPEEDVLSGLVHRFALANCPNFLVRMTPTHARAFLTLADDQPLSQAHAFVIGGEAFPVPLALALKAKFPFSRIYNHYGPTETVVGATLFPVEEGFQSQASLLPIGKPMDLTQTYVFNPSLQWVPRGFRGELLIGGSGVARGYVNLPKLTAEKFIPDPYSMQPGARLYRTGDLVSWSHAGALTFHGRVDDQVKLRGFRIELGEIEKVLGSCKGVQQAKVIIDGEGENGQLLAYATLDQATAPQAHALAALLSSGWPASKCTLLPNGMEICSHNPSETEFLYKELMEQNTYLKHGIQVSDGDCIFDVGANIGLFSLALIREHRNLTIHAFEPIPQVFEALKGNAEIYAPHEVHVYCQGLSDREMETQFHYYPFASVFSGIAGGDASNFEKVRGYLAASGDLPGEEVSAELIDEMIRDRLQTEQVTVALTTLSQHLRLHPCQTIDLLKIDVERSELQVLKGIEDRDWPRIRQVVVEVENFENVADLVEALLKSKGFEVVREQNQALEKTQLVNLYASRTMNQAKEHSAGSVRRWLSRYDFAATAEKTLRELLPPYMVPSKITFLDRFPLTPNGKLDRKALAALEHGSQQQFVEPETETEKQLCAIWQDILKLEKISVNDSFFELGGHSLLATRVVSAIAKHFGKQLPVRALFENPTVATLAAHLDQQAAQGFQEIGIAPRDQDLPLSFAQQRLWFIDQLEGGSPQYNMPAALQLRGQLDVVALKQSLDAILARHEILRTRYGTRDGKGFQTIEPPHPVNMKVVDLQRIPEGFRANATQELVAQISRKPFDLTRDAMLRCALIRLQPDQHVLTLTLHHIACDGWSIGLLVSEFKALYESMTLKKAARLPSLRLQYADFAHWQRRTFHEQRMEQELTYWRQKLDGIPQLHELPLDHPRPKRQDFRAGVFVQHFDRDLLDRLQHLALVHEATLFMVIQSSFALLLGRLSNQTDIVLGTPVAGRTHADLEPIIGFFINNVVLRTQLSENLTFNRLLTQAKHTALEAFNHQALPFESLVDALKPERMLSHGPIFQVTVSVQTNEDSRLTLPGLDIASFDNGYGKIDLDLQVTATQSEKGLSITWLYAEGLFGEDRIAKMAANYERLLTGIVERPEQEIFQLPMLSKLDERKLSQWQGTSTDFPQDQCIHELFEAQVARTPELPALVFEGEALSFRELNRQANQVAHYLVDQGIGPDMAVGLCLERSLELVIGLLGILKAGAFYVPLDPDYPADRLTFMIENSGVDMVLTQVQLLSMLPILNERRTLLMDPEVRSLVLADASPENLPRSEIGLSAKHLVYVIYTSGSTGQPKGVMVSHRSFVNLAWAEHLNLGVVPGDRVLSRISISFDPASGHLFSALIAGGTVYLADQHTNLDRFIADHQLTHVSLPASLLATVTPGAYPHLRVVTSGAESCPQELAASWAQNRRFFNHYGPTEATVISVLAKYQGKVDSVTIGFPLANTQCFVLDAQMQRVPVGVQGELYLAGTGLARGYLNQPALTASRFVPNPFPQHSSSRIYRTGDLVRYLSDGQLQFCGRLDDQVKLRGFRIELGEVETHLRSTGAFNEVRATIHGEGKNGRLVAYATRSEEVVKQRVSDSQLLERVKRKLKDQLPAYMVPSAIVLLRKLPLSPSGKVDTSALPEPEALEPKDYHPPASETERLLAAFWMELLDVEQVSVTENFFDLGGNSLLAMKLVAQIESHFQREVEIRHFFDHPTLRQLAAWVDDSDLETSNHANLLVPLTKNEGLPNLFFLPGAGVTLAAYRPIAALLEDRFCVWLFDPQSQMVELKAQGDIQSLAKEYASAIKTCQGQGPYRLIGHSFGGRVAFELGCYLEGQGDLVEIAMVDSMLFSEEDTQEDIGEEAVVDMLLNQIGGSENQRSVTSSGEKRRSLLERLVQLKIISSSAAEKRLEDFLQVTIAQVNMHKKYVPSGKFAGKINVLYAEEGSLSKNLKGLVAKQTVHCCEKIATHLIHGSHVTLLNLPHVRTLRDRLVSIFGTDSL